jgi:hypothetical protein
MLPFPGPALAMLPGYPPPAPTPSTHRWSLRTLLAKKYFRDSAPIFPNETVVAEEFSVSNKHIEWTERKILAMVAYIYYF